MTLLRAQVEAIPCQTIEELSNALIANPGGPPKNICNRLVKQREQVLGFSIICTEENRANRSTTCNLLLQRYNTEQFFDRLIAADETMGPA
ncbi:UNVERIFIED_CONTAM: hypothetical protein NCL1_12030 [Trichonephila clavipes]